MELVNELAPATNDPAARLAAETVVSLIQPYAPHIAEELWQRLGNERLWEQPWPVADETLLERDTFELEYRPISTRGELDQMVVVITDVTIPNGVSTSTSDTTGPRMISLTLPLN